MARRRVEGVLCLLRGTDEHCLAVCHAAPPQSPMAHGAPATEPTATDGLASHGAARRSLSTATEHPSPVAGAKVPRQTPEVGAVCVNCARTDLCGGRSAMTVPTAIDIRSGRGGRNWLADAISFAELAKRLGG